MKLAPGRLNMSRNMYDSSLRRILLGDGDNKEKIPETLPLYVAADFPVQPTLAPMLDLVHNCFVYPIKADLSKFMALKEARGLPQIITVRVSAHESDSDPGASGLPIFFGKSHESLFVDSVTCSVATGSSTKVIRFYFISRFNDVLVSLLDRRAETEASSQHWIQVSSALCFARTQRRSQEGGHGRDGAGICSSVCGGGNDGRERAARVLCSQGATPVHQTGCRCAGRHPGNTGCTCQSEDETFIFFFCKKTFV